MTKKAIDTCIYHKCLWAIPTGLWFKNKIHMYLSSMSMPSMPATELLPPSLMLRFLDRNKTVENTITSDFDISMNSIIHTIIIHQHPMFELRLALKSVPSFRSGATVWSRSLVHMRCCLRCASMAASNDRIVSSGRSSLLRVGFERSGSAIAGLECSSHQE